MNLRSFKLLLLIFVEYLKRNKVWIFISLLAIGTMAYLILRFNVITAPSSIRIGLVGTYQEHDLPIEVTRLVSKGLVVAGEDFRFKPELVSGWEVNNNATSFKFKLKENLKWSDGSPIRAADISFNIPNVSVSYPDERVIQFNLKEPYSPFPSLLTAPVYKKGTLLGTGPYKISKVEKSRIFITKITLDPVEGNLPRLFMRFYPNEKVAETGFNLGEVQAIIGATNIKDYLQNKQIKIKRLTDYSKIVTILFQNNDSLLKNRSLRQALAYQAPQIKGEEVANNPYPPKSWAYNADSKKYLSNPDEANSALERAKSSISFDMLKSELILTTTPNLEDAGKAVASAWKQLGLNIKLRIESGIPQNFQALLITQSIPSDPDQYFLWHATQTKTNLTKYDSKRVDKDLEDGRKLLTEEDRKQKYFDFQKALLEDAPASFLYFPKDNIIYLRKVEGLLNKVMGF